jgi:hypothetical protein
MATVYPYQITPQQRAAIDSQLARAAQPAAPRVPVALPQSAWLQGAADAPLMASADGVPTGVDEYGNFVSVPVQPAPVTVPPAQTPASLAQAVSTPPLYGIAQALSAVPQAVVAPVPVSAPVSTPPVASVSAGSKAKSAPAAATAQTTKSPAQGSARGAVPAALATLTGAGGRALLARSLGQTLEQFDAQDNADRLHQLQQTPVWQMLYANALRTSGDPDAAMAHAANQYVALGGDAALFQNTMARDALAASAASQERIMGNFINDPNAANRNAGLVSNVPMVAGVTPDGATVMRSPGGSLYGTALNPAVANLYGSQGAAAGLKAQSALSQSLASIEARAQAQATRDQLAQVRVAKAMGQTVDPLKHAAALTSALNGYRTEYNTAVRNGDLETAAQAQAAITALEQEQQQALGVQAGSSPAATVR